MKRKNASIQPDLFEQDEPRVLPALSQKEQLATLVEALLLDLGYHTFLLGLNLLAVHASDPTLTQVPDLEKDFLDFSGIFQTQVSFSTGNL